MQSSNQSIPPFIQGMSPFQLPPHLQQTDFVTQQIQMMAINQQHTIPPSFQEPVVKSVIPTATNNNATVTTTEASSTPVSVANESSQSTSTKQQSTFESSKPVTEEPEKKKELKPGEFRLPQSLERILNLMDKRVDEVGITKDKLDEHILGPRRNREKTTSEIIEDEEFQPVKKEKSSKQARNMKKKQKRKLAKLRKREMSKNKAPTPTNESETKQDNDDIVVEYVPEDLNIDKTNPDYGYFKKIMSHFRLSEFDKSKIKDDKTSESTEATKGEHSAMKIRDRTLLEEEQDDEEQAETDVNEKPKMSKKQLKKLTRLSVAELKQLVVRPDVVEMYDVTARDPKLLVLLKSSRNTVPVPRHWCGKRKYLQGKRGIIKPPFDLPEFIKRTGIQEMRQALQDKEEQKSLKQKMREKVRPKIGKIEIDYQKLHDAFFKWQTKPRLSIHGDLYYEGKENEIKLKQKKPGVLSDELRIALGMPTGPAADRVPPPWLIAMQRYGPPPSYPNLKIPGLNALIPEGCSFGYHAGGWGKPPVDELGRPLYGDVFGTTDVNGDGMSHDDDDLVDKTIWGQLESEEEEEESEADEEESEKEASETEKVEEKIEGAVTPSGTTSAVPSLGLETPENIEIRKRLIEEQMETDTPVPLYHVLPEKQTSVGAALMGSSKIYEVPSSAKKKGSVEIALAPEELELDSETLERRYQQQVQNQLEKEDVSDLVTDHVIKANLKRRKRQQESQTSSSSSSTAKKHKDFKF